jgi:predicted ATP-dependent serine protease
MKSKYMCSTCKVSDQKSCEQCEHGVSTTTNHEICHSCRQAKTSYNLNSAHRDLVVPSKTFRIHYLPSVDTCLFVSRLPFRNLTNSAELPGSVYTFRTCTRTLMRKYEGIIIIISHVLTEIPVRGFTFHKLHVLAPVFLKTL